MSSQLTFDEDQAKALEEIYMSEKALARRRRGLELLNLSAGDTLLDLGCGPGFLSVEAVEFVGTRGQVHGLDSSGNMLAIAQGRAERKATTDVVQFHEGDALNLPFPDNNFDAAAVLQVYEYISDVDAALKELVRVLKPGAHYVILDTDFASMILHSEDSALTDKILTIFDGHLADPHLPRKLGPKLQASGLPVDLVEPFVPLSVGRADVFMVGLKKLIANYVKGTGQLTDFEVDTWLQNLDKLDSSNQTFISVTQFFFSGRKSP